MSFGFDENTPTVAGGGKKINTMGINVVKIKDIEVKSTPNGCCFDIEVINSQGQTASQRYFEPTTTGQYPCTPEDLDWKIAAIVTQVKNIASMYMPENYTIPAQPTFEAFLNKVLSDIRPKFDKVDVKTIIVYNKNGFPSLKQFGTLFEAVNNTDPAKKLVIGPKDILVAPKGMSAEEITQSIAPKKDDLPF